MRALLSPDIVGRVVDKLGLADAADVTMPPAQARERAIALLSNSLSITPGPSADAATISARNTDPALAAAIINQLLDEYGADRSSARVSELDRLRTQVATAREDMLHVRAALHDYRPVISSPNVEAASLATPPRHAMSNPAAADEAVTDFPNDAENAQAVADLKAELAQVINERAELLQRYGHIHPDVVALTRKIRHIRFEIWKTTSRRRLVARASPKAGHRHAQAVIGRADLVRQTRLEEAAHQADAKYQLLSADLRRAEAANSGLHADAAHRTRVPSVPDLPATWKFIAVGLVGSLLAGGAVFAWRESRVRGFRSSEAAGRALGIPVVAAVPDIGKMPASRSPDADAFAQAIHDPGSGFKAAIEQIFAGLGFENEDGPRSLIISSAMAGEGKTTVAIALARLAASRGRRVILLDCDVRRPAATELLAPDLAFGLADVLQGHADLEQALTRDPASDIAFIGSKADGPVATGLVGSPAMQRLLASLAPAYDLIILDAAPTLAVVETRIAASFVDRVLLVARWRKTPADATRLAAISFSKAHVRVSAVALTRVRA